jgi:DNA polymerase alpha subunit B
VCDSQRISLVSDPCTFSVGGVVFGTTSVDTLFDINSDVATTERGERRVLSYVRELLTQRSYYPIFPPSRGVPLASGQYGHVEMPVTPDVLLLPSKLKPFCGRVSGTLAVGPGTLCKAKTGGTYARLEIAPITEKLIGPSSVSDPFEDMAESEAELPGTSRHKVAERAMVQVVRV